MRVRCIFLCGRTLCFRNDGSESSGILTMDRQPLVDQNKAIRFTEQSFDPVPSSSTEKEESTGRRIHLKLVFDNGAESVNGFSHIRIAADNIDLLKSGDVT